MALFNSESHNYFTALQKYIKNFKVLITFHYPPTKYHKNTTHPQSHPRHQQNLQLTGLFQIRVSPGEQLQCLLPSFFFCLFSHFIPPATRFVQKNSQNFQTVQQHKQIWQTRQADRFSTWVWFRVDHLQLEQTRSVSSAGLLPILQMATTLAENFRAGLP